jgi:tetratricopeptide (TPR) repeat protein
MTGPAPNRIPAQLPLSLARKLRQALVALQTGDIDTAGRLYSEVLQHRPGEFDALHMLGVIEYQRGDFSKALRLIAAALRSNGNSADGWSNLGLVLHAQGDYAKALTTFDRALELQPNRADVRNNRANALRELTCDAAVHPTGDAPGLALKRASTSPTPCKICGSPALLYGVVDFHRSCNTSDVKQLPLAGLPVYYRRCAACGFLFTDAFDDWNDAQFKTHIYNDGYLALDPDYVSKRPSINADMVERLFGAYKAHIRVLDYGGGNDVLCTALRRAGFRAAVTYDPFTPDYAARPEATFDLVTCFETLEHMPDPMAGVAAMLANLAEDGVVLFSTLLQPQDFDRMGLNWWYVGPRNGHISLFSRNALALVWRRHGYQTASFNDNMHFAFRTVPGFARHLLKNGPPAPVS